MAKIISDKPEDINEESMVTYVEDKIKEAENIGLEQQWAVNIAYLTGKQWVAYDKNSRKIVEKPKENWEERVTINRIRPAIRTELAKITKSKIQFTVIAATNDEDDIDSAKVGTQSLDYIWRRANMDEKRFKAALWQITTGTGILKSFWNAKLGEEVELNTLDDKGEFEKDGEGKEVTKGSMLGDVDCSVVSPFDFRFDPSADEFDDSAWCCESKLRTTDYVKEEYDVEVGNETNLESTNLFNGMLANINGSNNVDTKPIKIKNSVIVKEYWEMPSKKHSKGRHITIANGKLLQLEDMPYKRLPYFVIAHNLVPGRVHGSSNIEDLIPVQREHNKTRTQRRLNQTRTGNQRLLVQQNSLLSDPTMEPGEIIEYRQGSNMPTWETPPTEPGHIQAELELQLRDFEDISGVHEVSNGAAASGVKSGVALSFLAEQDDTKLGPIIHNIESTYEKWAQFVLELIQDNYLEPRMIKIVGKNNAVETKEFQGSDLKGNTDVRVVAGSAMPKSTAARQEFVLNLWDRKILDDPQKALKLLEFGNIEEIYDDLSIDVNQAKAEQKQWINSDFSHKTRDFYNHEVHITEHNKFRKSTDYEELDPQVQQQVDAHVEEHKVFMQPPPQAPQTMPPGTSPGMPQAPQGMTPQQQPQQLDINAIMASLSPQEQAVLAKHPELIDQVIGGQQGGGNNENATG